jgi:PKD repeat protein
VTFDAISKGNIQKISWNFGDGNQDEGQEVHHTFLLPGIYRIQATAQGNDKQATAQIILKIGGMTQQQFALQPKANSVGSYHTAEFSLGISSIGDIDLTEWTFNGKQTSTKSPNQTFQKIFDATGTYQVAVKGYINQTLQAAATFNIGIASPGSMLKADMLNPEINQKTSFQTQIFALSTNDISYVTWDFGDGTVEKTQ